MGAFSKALKDAQYLKPLADSLSEYKQRLDEQKGREALMQMMDTINKQQNQLFTDGQTTKPANDFEVKPQSGGTFSNLAPQMTEMGTEKPYNTPQRPQILQPGQTQDPGFTYEAYNPTTNPAHYKQAVDKRNQLFSKLVPELIANKNVDPNQLNQMLQISQLGIPSAPFTPKSEVKEYNPKNDRYKVTTNPDGTTTMELLQKGEDPNVRNQWTKVGQGSEGGKDYALMRNFVTGQTERFLLGNTQDKRTNVNVTNEAPKEEKWKDVTGLIVEKKNPAFTNKDGRVVEKTKDEIKRANEKLYYTAVNKLVPSAKVWYDVNIKRPKKENMSQEDFLNLIEKAITPDPKTKKTKISADAAQDLLDFMAYRPEIFDDLKD